jgi:hypothetical protein
MPLPALPSLATDHARIPWPRHVLAGCVRVALDRLILAGLILAGLVLPCAAAAGAGPGQPAPGPTADAIEVVDGGWGGGRPDEIRRVLAGVTAVFLPSAPGAGATLPLLRIRHRFGGPRIEYQRDRDGRVVIFLSARDERWYQYVYQFAHEYCHLLSHFDRKRQGEDIVRDHQWFEEALCETASLYAVRRLARQWCDAGAEPLLRRAAPQLVLYDRQLLGQAHRQLADGADMAQWYASHQDALRSQPYLRELNELAAAQLLPLFERDPGRWAALAFLNPVEPSPGLSFAGFLARWRNALPAGLQTLVAEIQQLFGLGAPPALPAPAHPAGVAVSAVPRPPDTAPGCGN